MSKNAAMQPSSLAAALVLAAVVSLWPAPRAQAQQAYISRASAALLGATPPSERVEGLPGRMATRSMQCRDAPSDELRRRIVDISAQEWGFFGFPIQDELTDARLLPPGMGPNGDRASFLDDSRSRRRWWRSSSPEEAGRVAASIAGYWAVTAEGPGIVRRQNDAWNGEDGIGSRWVDPWSAAFVSWVMCEAGLGSPERFRRSIAHRVYIDQAILARDGGVDGGDTGVAADRGPAFVAYDLGETAVEPGDMLCASSRPPYRDLAERRGQLGVGARTHCDIVVEVDAGSARILTVGGNVMRSVSLKIFPARVGEAGHLQPLVPNERRPLFAHLKLRAASIEPDALHASPTLQALVCAEDPLRSPRLTLVATTMGEPTGSPPTPGLPAASASAEPGASGCPVF